MKPAVERVESPSNTNLIGFRHHFVAGTEDAYNYRFQETFEKVMDAPALDFPMYLLRSFLVLSTDKFLR